MDCRFFTLVVCFFPLAVIDGSKCVLPKTEKAFNWNMLPGTWYQMLITLGPFETVYGPCLAVTNIREIPGDGVYLEARDIRSVSNTGVPNYFTIPVHRIPYGSSPNTFRLDDKYESLWADVVTEHSDAMDAKTTTEDIVDMDKMYHSPMTFLTDYKHYYIALQCAGDARRVLSHSRHPHPSDEDMLRVKEALTKIGDGWDKVPLYSSGCARLNIRDPILNY